MIKGTPTISTLWHFHMKVALYHWKCFFATISAEIFQICQATSSAVQFIKILKVFLHQMLRQGTEPLGFKMVLVKLIDCKLLQFEKYNTNNRSNSGTFNITCWYCFYLICVCIFKTYMWYVLMYMCTSSSYCFDWKLWFVYVWVKSSVWKG